MLEHAVVRVADDQLARVPMGGAQIRDAPGIVEGLAGDRFALIGKRDLPIAMIASLHAHRDDAGSWHTGEHAPRRLRGHPWYLTQSVGTPP